MKQKLMLITSLLIALIVSLPITLAATQNLIYDANGNLVTGDSKYREYDGFNHLVRIRDGNNATGLVLEEYDWHPLEERTLVKHVYENGSWKESIYYPSKDFVRVKNTSGTYDYKYIYQNGQLIAQELVGGQKNFMLNDHKGSVQVVVNESGAKVEETFYSPFGEIISGGATSRFDYEGKEFDSVVGDYDYHARKYLTGPHIFGQPDTLLPNVYDPQQLNRYVFERNNPTKNTDPTGHLDPASSLLIGTIYLILIVSKFIFSVPYSKQLRDDAQYNEVYPQENIMHNANQPLEPAIIHDASPANKVNTEEKSMTIQEPKSPKDSDENLESLDDPKKKGLGDKSLIQQEDKNQLDKKIEEIKPVAGGRSASSGGGGGRSSSQIAQEEVENAEEQGGYGEYKEDPNGGATWWTVTPSG